MIGKSIATLAFLVAVAHPVLSRPHRMLPTPPTTSFSAHLLLLVGIQVRILLTNPCPAHSLVHVKRAIVTKWVTVYAPEVVIYVDRNGVPYKTEYGVVSTATHPPVNLIASVQSTYTPLPSPISLALPVPEHSTAPAPIDIPSPHAISTPNEVPSSVVVPSAIAIPSPITAPAPAAIAPDVTPADAKYASQAAGVSKSNDYGISWTPFNGVEGSTTCKPQGQASSEFARIALQQFTSVRVYGTDCNQVTLAMIAAKAIGLQLMVGVFDLKNTQSEVHELIRQVNTAGGDWSIVHTITIGNEDVEKGLASPVDVINAIAIARQALSTTSFQGAIVHVDTMAAIYKHPELCGDKAGDYIAANIHPFFNSGTPAILAGKFVSQQIEILRQCSQSQSQKRGDHRVVVTETGWPTGGNANGLAVPGRAQQFAAIASIKKEIPTDVYLYSAFNNNWLANNAGTFGAEHYWGILDN
jgi:exo-beta-1,3-glucanase (GH17 family)